MNRFTLLGIAALLLASLRGAAHAQSAATGRIAGRVFNSRTGQYLENARISIDGTTLAVFTDAGGEYEFFAVPTGSVVLRASFTSMEAKTEGLTIASGETVRRDFDLGSASATAGPVPGVVRLSQFVVGASKQMDAAAIAINEQRYAANIKTVSSAQSSKTTSARS